MNSIVVLKPAALLACAALLSSSTLLVAQAGSLDPTFGTGGIVTTPNTGTAVATVIQSDGKILVAGSVPIGQFQSELGLARYNTNGSLDSTFGSGGIVSNSASQAFGMALQSDGKIVVAATQNTSEAALEVIRFNTNGSLDTTFGTGGIASFGRLFLTPLSGGVVVQPNGDIVVAVFSGSNASSAFVRFLANGQLDSSFGTKGSAGLVTGPQTLALLSNGKILVASSFVFSSGSVTRYNSNGSLDATFGLNGQALGLALTSAVAPLSNGKLIVAGTLDSAAPPPGTNASPQGFALVRDNLNGTIDATFGTHGGVVTPFPGNAFSAAATVAVQSNGDIVAAGVTEAKNPVFGQEPSSFALARYTANGQLDTTFGTNGLVTTAFDNNTAFVSALAIQSDGKIVAVGSDNPATFGAPNNGFTLARYLDQ